MISAPARRYDYVTVPDRDLPEIVCDYSLGSRSLQAARGHASGRSSDDSRLR